MKLDKSNLKISLSYFKVCFKLFFVIFAFLKLVKSIQHSKLHFLLMSENITTIQVFKFLH